MGAINQTNYQDYGSTKKVKITFEVSPGYIEERASKDLLKSKKDSISAVADFLAFNSLKDKIDKGQTEFALSSLDVMDKDQLDVFNTTMGFVAACILVNSKDKE